MTNCSIRVFIIDDDPQTCRDLEELCEFKHWQSHVASHPRDKDAVLAEARAFRPHVAIVDMRLVEGDTSNREGFEHIRRLTPTKCVVYSAYLAPEDVRDAWKEDGAFDVVSKAGRIERLVEAVQTAASSSCACVLSNFKVAWPEGKTFQEMFRLICSDENAPADQMLDVMGRLFHRENQNTAEQRIITDWLDTSEATGSAGVHQNAAILKAWRHGQAPLLVKFGEPDRIKREAEKFEEVRNILPGARFANAENHVIWWDIGAIAYRLVGARLHETRTFAKFYQDTAFKGIKTALNELFDSVLGPFHNQQKPSTHIDLFDAYDEALNKEKKKLMLLLENSKEHPDLPPEFNILREPIAWLRHNRQRYRIPNLMEAYTHGDLHSSNILVDEHNQVWLIDFERVGFGPRLRDYVELAVDLLTRLFPFSEDLNAYYRLVCGATAPDSATCDTADRSPEMEKALRTIRLLHQLAGPADPREWWWGLLLDSLFVLQVFENSADKRYKRAWILASVCTYRLEGSELPVLVDK